MKKMETNKMYQKYRKRKKGKIVIIFNIFQFFFMIFVEFLTIFNDFHVFFATWSECFATWDFFRGSGVLPQHNPLFADARFVALI